MRLRFRRNKSCRASRHKAPGRPGKMNRGAEDAQYARKDPALHENLDALSERRGGARIVAEIARYISGQNHAALRFRKGNRLECRPCRPDPSRLQGAPEQV